MKPRSITAARPRDYLLVRRAARAAKDGNHKLNYGLRIMLEARRPGSVVNPSLALALIEQESGFKNIFGCDHGPGKAFCHQPVTKERVQHLRRSGLKNGIGPAQLTSDAYVDPAERDGGAHKTSVNIATGLDGLSDLLKKYNGDKMKALATYNAGNPHSAKGRHYAGEVLKRERRYQRRLNP